MYYTGQMFLSLDILPVSFGVIMDATHLLMLQVTRKAGGVLVINFKHKTIGMEDKC